MGRVSTYRELRSTQNAVFFAVTILFFTLGAVIGNVFVTHLGTYAIWGNCAILLACLALIPIKTEA